MSKLPHIVISAALALLFAPACYSQSVPAPTEVALRESFAQFQAALVRHDVPALKESLTPDAVWVFPDSNSKISRDAVASYVATFWNSIDPKFEIVHAKIYPAEGRATLVLRGQHLGLPKQDGKYAMVWNREPLLARWRFEGGTWRLYFITDNPTEATAMAKAEGLQ
ncbi:MAG: nuclear transport factor 2 family protein [Caldimonas sp.]